MAESQTNQSCPFDNSYQNVIEQLDQWRVKTVTKLDQISDDVLLDMSTTWDNVHYFASFTNALLIEEENQLRKVTSLEEMNVIEERINQIIFEVELLQSLSFHLNCDSVRFNGEFQINLNKSQDLLSSTFSYLDHTPRTISDASDLSTNNNEQSIVSNNIYRFLISRTDAIELKKATDPNFHLTSLNDGVIHECVLTLNAFDFDSFVHIFTSYWNLFPTNNSIRLLLSLMDISFITDERLTYLAERFQLDEMKIFPDFCPKSDEKVLFISGKRRDLIKDCVEEVCYNIGENRTNDCTKQHINLYNPDSLSSNDIDELMRLNSNYGGFIQHRNKTINGHHSRSHLIEDEETLDDDDDDLWDENDEWWSCQSGQSYSSEIIQREMNVNNIQAGVIIGLKASRIDRIKQKTGAYLYINGDTKDLKRTVFIKGTHEQTDRAYTYIENLLERHKNGQLPMKQRCSYNNKRKGK